METAQPAQTAPDQRPAGFGSSYKSANQAYKTYVAGLDDSTTAMDFKTWLAAEHAKGNYTRAERHTKGGWKKGAADTAPAQPNVASPGEATGQTAPTQQAAKTDAPATAATAPATPWRPLGMQPVVALIVVAGVCYLGYRLLK